MDVTNGKDYNGGLDAYLVWQTQVLAGQCQAHGPPSEVQRRRGSALPDRQRQFNLALSQAIGMVQSLLKLAGLGWQMAAFDAATRSERYRGLQLECIR